MTKKRNTEVIDGKKYTDLESKLKKEQPFENGVLWCITKLFTHDKNFTGTHLIKKYLVKAWFHPSFSSVSSRVHPSLSSLRNQIQAFTYNRRLSIRICNYFHPRISQISTTWSSRWQFLLFLLAESIRPIRSKHTPWLSMFYAICWRFAYSCYRMVDSTFRNTCC